MASISSTAINPLPNSSAISFSSRGPLRPTDPIVRAITPTATASEDRSIVSAGFSIKGANAPLTSSVSRNSGVAIASSSSGSISSSSSGGNGNGLAIGLGVGLSLGIILLAAVVRFSFFLLSFQKMAHFSSNILNNARSFIFF
jgi:hypothetical protein